MNFWKTLKYNYQANKPLKLTQAFLKKYQINNKFQNRIVQVVYLWVVMIH